MKKAEFADSNVELPKGYRAYKLKGIDHTIIARKGGPSTEQVRTAEAYTEVRKHQKEFGIASMMAKALRNSLSPGMSAICETYVSGRLTAQFRNLAKQEEGKTGKRPLYPSKHGHLLNGFEFNTTAPYDEIFGAKYFVRPGSRRGQVILHFPAFIPDKTFKKPKEATNFKINARLVAISDYHFDEDTKQYVPLDKICHGKYGSYESPMLPLLKIPLEPMTAQVSVENVKNMTENTGLFLVMAVSFFHYENGNFQHLSKESGMQIRRVY